MFEWTRHCETDIRLNVQFLNRSRPLSRNSMEVEFWTVNTMVLNREIIPEQAGQRLQNAMATAR